MLTWQFYCKHIMKGAEIMIKYTVVMVANDSKTEAEVADTYKYTYRYTYMYYSAN